MKTVGNRVSKSKLICIKTCDSLQILSYPDLKYFNEEQEITMRRVQNWKIIIYFLAHFEVAFM